MWPSYRDCRDIKAQVIETLLCYKDHLSPRFGKPFETDDDQHDARSTGAMPKTHAKNSGKKSSRKKHAAPGASCEEEPFSVKLRRAVERGDAGDVCAILLGEKTFSDVPDRNGDTSLHVAIQCAHEEIVVMLMLAGADTRAQNNDGQTPLHTALCHRDAELANVLMIRDAKNEVQDVDGNTPLHIAAGIGSAKIMENLVAAGVDISIQNSDGSTALHTMLSSTEVVKMPNFMIKKPKNFVLHEGEEYPFDTVVSFEFTNKPEDVEESFECIYVQEPVTSEESIFRLYKMDGIANMIMNKGSANDVQDMAGDTPLHLALRAGHQGVVRKLLFHNVRTQVKNMSGISPLEEALTLPRNGIAKMILSMCALRGIVIDWENLDADQDNIQLGKELWVECEAELQKMKQTKVGPTYVSYYDVAKEPLYQLAVYLRNDEIRKVLLQADKTVRFPNYDKLITFRVQKAEVRRILSDQCLSCFSVVSRKLPPLPVTSIDVILTFLSDQDIKNCVEAFKCKA